MASESDYGELLAAYSAVQRKQKWLGPLKMVLALASAALGAGWTAHGYLGQLATKDDVAKLIAGQQAQIRALDSRVAALHTRVAVLEDRTSGLKVRP